MYDVVVIGGGVVGAATAYELSRYSLSVAVLEAENDVATGTTKANSAIIHAGYDAQPGTLMARLNVEGSRMAKTICRDLDVPYRQIGSMVLAFDEQDKETLQRLLDQSRKNGVPDARIISGDEARTLEPGISPDAICALLAPSAAIVNPWDFALAMLETAVLRGVGLFRNHAVTAIASIPGGYEVRCGSRLLQTRMIVNAAGVHADKIHNMVAAPTFTMKPARGEYYLLDKSEGDRVGRIIFRCPTPHGKGVLVTPTVHGNLLVGPNHQPVDADDVATTAAGLAGVAASARTTVPDVRLGETIRSFAGVRAECDRNDFVIEAAAPGFIDLAGIKSPGLSAAPAIGVVAVKLLQQEGLSLETRTEQLPVRKVVRFKELPLEEKAALIARENAFGRIACRCESITEGEILSAIHSPIPPVSIDGVKRRCNTGMGRCQGGFCGSRVMELLAKEGGVDSLDIELDKTGSTVLSGVTKKGTVNHVCNC